MLSPGLHNRCQNGIRTASFWLESLADDARTLTDSLREVSAGVLSAPDQVDRLERLMAGGTLQAVYNRLFSFDPRSILQIGADLQARTLTTTDNVVVTARPSSYDLGLTGYVPLGDEAQSPEVLQTEGFQFLLVPVSANSSLSLSITDTYPKFALPFPNSIRAHTIRSKNRELVAGLDFIQSDGCLIFWDQPTDLFPENNFVLRRGTEQVINPFGFVWQMDDFTGSGHYISTYLRRLQTTSAFALAIAEAGGAAILPEEDTVREIRHSSNLITTYVFDHQTLEVSYPHTPLQINQTYPAQTIIGNAVQVFGHTQTGASNWWRQVDWTGGMSLDGICPFKGLSLPDTPTMIASYNGTPVLPVVGNSATVTLYNKYVTAAATLGNIPLSAAVAIGTFVNPIDFIFQWLLGFRALIIQIDPRLGIVQSQRAKDFAIREKPVGSILIFK